MLATLLLMLHFLLMPNQDWADTIEATFEAFHHFPSLEEIVHVASGPIFVILMILRMSYFKDY